MAILHVIQHTQLSEYQDIQTAHEVCHEFELLRDAGFRPAYPGRRASPSMARAPPSLGLLSGWPLGIALILGSGVAFVIVMGWQAGRGARWCGIIVHSSAAPGEEGLSGRVWLGWAAHIILVVRMDHLLSGRVRTINHWQLWHFWRPLWDRGVWAQTRSEIRVNKLGMTEVEARTAKSFEPPA